ncbi:hypothetical protein CARUB_v10010825mg [Capsella rubella]|uniref:Uncharacterized protein n=1 Tax=Capsella rubella TaxID=81985 RepID=R0I8M7_9BRAS|nr:hypothetical protein CARUB_v10010825mg [Capsella rubella]
MTFEVKSRNVVGRCGHFGCLVAPEPNSGFRTGFPDLRHPFAPFPPTDASVK